MLGITREGDGWHTYYLRRRARVAPLPRLAAPLGEVLRYALARLATSCGKPWRRLGAVLRPRA